MNTTWSTGSVAAKNEVKHPQIHYSRNMVLRILWLSFSQQRLRWYGHLQYAMSCIKSITDLAIPSTRQWGRPLDRSVVRRKTAVTPLLTHWNHCSLVISHRDVVRKCEDWCQRLWPVWHWHGGPVCDAVWARFLSLAQSKLRLCSANHRAGYFSNLACDWLSIVWVYSKQKTTQNVMLLIPLNGTQTAHYSKNGLDEDMNDWPVLFLLQLSTRLAALPVLSLTVTVCAAVLAYL